MRRVHREKWGSLSDIEWDDFNSNDRDSLDERHHAMDGLNSKVKGVNVFAH